MRHVTVLTTDRMPGGTRPFADGDLHIEFSEQVRDPANLPMQSEIWAFVDWLLPEMSGLELCRRFRSNGDMRRVHITMLLDADDEDDKRRALRAGADDYMIKPVSRQHLIERVSRASAGGDPAENWLTAGLLEVDLVAGQAHWRGRPLWLAPNQFRLLCFFMRNSGRVLTRDQIIAGLTDTGPLVDPQTVTVWVKRLRHALRDAGADRCLRTVRPKGYALDVLPQ